MERRLEIRRAEPGAIIASQLSDEIDKAHSEILEGISGVDENQNKLSMAQREWRIGAGTVKIQNLLQKVDEFGVKSLLPQELISHAEQDLKEFERRL